jgi:hypothetical protein
LKHSNNNVTTLTSCSRQAGAGLSGKPQPK